MLRRLLECGDLGLDPFRALELQDALVLRFERMGARIVVPSCFRYEKDLSIDKQTPA
jgi:hypothetical protein